MRLIPCLAASLLLATPALAGDLAPLGPAAQPTVVAAPASAKKFTASTQSLPPPTIIPAEMPPDSGLTPYGGEPGFMVSDFDLYHPDHFGLFPAPDFGVLGGRDPNQDAHDSVFTSPGYFNLGPQPKAFTDFTFRHGAPRYTRDQGLSYQISCGFVYHRFYDEFGASVDRPVRVCN